MSNIQCTECGVFKNREKGYILVEPSDCHEIGGHYISEFSPTGELIFSGRPWQAGIPRDLTESEMSEAITAATVE